MSGDTLARVCHNCRQPYIVMAERFLHLKGACEILAEALDKHQQRCPNTCAHCRSHMPTVGYQRDVCSQRCEAERRAQRRRLDAEEVIHLTTCGVPVDHALERVGWTAMGADQWARRHRRRDVLDAIRGAA